MKRHSVLTTVLLTAVLIQMLPAHAGDIDIQWWTIDGGGEILMNDPDASSEWELSGTIGQWDATDSRGSRIGSWELTGGFWSFGIVNTDRLFSDRFSDQNGVQPAIPIIREF
ncbi:MAG: hypothetical protein AAGJ52_00410 [Pseudomonadota bacterium]